LGVLASVFQGGWPPPCATGFQGWGAGSGPTGQTYRNPRTLAGAGARMVSGGGGENHFISRGREMKLGAVSPCGTVACASGCRFISRISPTTPRPPAWGASLPDG